MEARLDPVTTRCRDCGEEKPLDRFPLQRGGRFGRHPLCKPCRVAQEQRRYWRDRDAILERAKNDPKRKERARWRRLERKYGVTAEVYATLVFAQSGRCAVCAEPAPLRVDHDHATGRLRGLLCDRCNLAVGLMRDDPSLLRAAGAYLRARCR